jgi:hypothetical protein
MWRKQPCKMAGTGSALLKKANTVRVSREELLGLLLPVALVALFWLCEVIQ